MANDPSGLILDTAVDAGFVAWDIDNLMTGSRKDFEENLAALGLDLLGMAIPFVTGLGAASRVALHADDVLRLADNGLHYADDVVDACRRSFTPDTSVKTPSGAVTTVEHPRTMWDLTVDRNRTFAVGNGGWVVHNNCGINLSTQGIKHTIERHFSIGAHSGGASHFNPSVDLVKLVHAARDLSQTYNRTASSSGL